jgi:hypothetical protein
MPSHPLIAIAAALAFSTAFADEPKSITQSGKVDTVTLYRGQALVSRRVPIDGPQGAVELVVPDLPAGVVPDSLFAEGGEGLQVRAVRFRTRAVGEAPREEVRKLDEAMAALAVEQQAVAASLQLAEQELKYLEKLEGFVAPTAQAELAKGVLDAEQLVKLTEFSFARREAAVKRQLADQQHQKKLADQMTLLQRKRAELTDGSSKTVREAIVFLDKKIAGPGTVKLSYLSGNCGWGPSYNFRAVADAKAVQVEYNAIISQRSGEDWSGVELTLSTASPVLSAKGPGLAPFEIALSGGGVVQTEAVNEKPSKVAAQFKNIQEQRIQAQEGQTRAYGNREQLDNGVRFNTAANDYQVLELIGQKDVLRSLAQESPGGGEGPSIDYKLPDRISMASRNDQQIVQVMKADLAGTLYHMATPVLTTYVYREAEIVNTADEDLLGGPISVYLDGRFVGRGEIGTVARGQTFVVGFGADPQLRARRELADKDELVQGGNRVLSFQYRLSIENFKDKPVQVRVVDRLPYAEREHEIKITLDSKKNPLSDDAFYLRRERPRGILRWDVDVPAAAAGEKAAVVDYVYTLEFARNLEITNPTAPGEALQRDLEQLERFRNYRQ